jgi:hypothetical protein
MSVDVALRGTPFAMLARHVQRHEITAVLDLLLLKFKRFFNYNKNVTEEQIPEISNLILAEFSDLGFATIQHCFNLIKLGKKPFDTDNEELFEALDGKKILERLTRYRAYLSAERERIHNDTRAANEMDAHALLNVSLKKPALFEALQKMTKQQLHTKVDAQIQREEERRKATEAAHNALISEWTADYKKIKNPVATLEEYLQFNAESYRAARLKEEEAQFALSKQPKPKPKK